MSDKVKWRDAKALRDRIEELEAENERLNERLRESYRYIGKDGKTVLARDLEDERDELKAKLEKAVEALKRAAQEHRVIAGMDLIGASATAYNAARDAEATLAELKGGGDE